MSHPRKKSGERKDKKNERMREDVTIRKIWAHDPKPHTDQPDIQSFKSGGADDKNRQARPNQSQ
jgi:hypothetical protein